MGNSAEPDQTPGRIVIDSLIRKEFIHGHVISQQK
jgi:hypothetical protein